MSLDPDDFGVNNGGLWQWRQHLKLKLLEQRRWKSDFSGLLLTEGCHMHEGIISRAVVPRNIWWHYKIHHPYNCFLLLPEEHIPFPPSREWAVERAFELYGPYEVQNWFYNLPWKNLPFRI